ncbi:LysR family transcriptional regulator [Hydrogenophaga sp.]|uniref:LysR family transcriptional regulator n=1 Tax=Hydrogenophaga sp. TaxID=1904254 RepID=UPI00391909BA
MNHFDWSDLDARALQQLVAVVDTGSVTAAAQQLGVTQSAVSHQLDKLRAITGDPLFVKSGRGIVATARAQQLAEDARGLLRQLERFAHAGDFDPARWQATVTIAANDFQRDVLLPALAQRLREAAPGVVLRVIPSDVPSLEMLRDRVCDIAISPRPPEGSDILQQRIFEDRYRVFYDPAVRRAPATVQDYLAADHATVVYEPRRSLYLDRTLEAQGIRRRFVVTVPGFAGLPAFIKGSPLLATAPSLLRHSLMRDLAHAEVPVPCPTMPMYLIWHRQHHADASHRWLREQLLALAPAAVPGDRQGA